MAPKSSEAGPRCFRASVHREVWQPVRGDTEAQDAVAGLLRVFSRVSFG